MRWDIFSLLALPFKKHLEDAEFPGNSYTAQSSQLFSPQVWLTWPHPWLLHLPFALSPFWLWAQTCHLGSLLPCFTLASLAILMRIFCSNLWYPISWTKPNPLVLLTPAVHYPQSQKDVASDVRYNLMPLPEPISSATQSLGQGILTSGWHEPLGRFVKSMTKGNESY